MASNNPESSNAIAGALTYPAGNNNSQYQPVPNQPRQPRTLEGLLLFAMEATKAGDARGNTEDARSTTEEARGPQLEPMDEEKKKFLSDALSAHTVNVSELVKKNVKILSNLENLKYIKENDQLPEKVLIAFQELGEFVDDIDVANDFEKMGGFIIFPLCYSCKSVELHRWANLTLAQVCQNNPNCQERALRCCFLPVLLHKLKEHKHDDRTLRALSSMIRNYEPTMTAFVAQGGCEVLVGMLRHDDYSELTSAAFLITYLCRNSKQARDIFISNKIIQTIAEILKEGRSEASEYLLNILVTLLELQPDEVGKICRDPELDLKKILENHLQIPDVKNGRFLEEKEYCENVIYVAFEEPKKKAEGVLMERADR